MTRSSASPAAAGGRRGGRAAGLLPASRAPVAAARVPWWRTLGETSAGNVCFPVGRETAVLKWYVALREACFPVLSRLEELRSRVCV